MFTNDDLKYFYRCFKKSVTTRNGKIKIRKSSIRSFKLLLKVTLLYLEHHVGNFILNFIMLR